MENYSLNRSTAKSHNLEVYPQLMMPQQGPDLKPALPLDEYTVGWISALPVELAAARIMLDEEHQDLPNDPNDPISYILGTISKHHVVIACLPAGKTGTSPAATVAARMLAKFPSIRFGLMVGVGSGVPSDENDIRLGDVVVAQPHGTYGGVVQYDSGQEEVNGFRRTGHLNAPPQLLLHVLSNVQAHHFSDEPRFLTYLEASNNFPKFSRAKAGSDCLFDPSYHHVGGATCKKCNIDMILDREEREDSDLIQIHYGTIASGNTVIKNGQIRDEICTALGDDILCFEMEAAGLMDNFPCLVIRGICDYADSHKNKTWQPYAATTSAAFAKEVLSYISVADIENEPVHVSDEVLQKIAELHLEEDRSFHQEEKTRAKKQELQQQEERYHDCHRAFKTSTYEQFKNVNPKRVAETCSWVLTNKRYISWLEDQSNSLLWISADPGCGKSVLARSLIDIDLPKIPESLVCYFFFKDNEQQNGVSTAICALLHQVFTYSPPLMKHALKAWNQNGDSLRKETFKLWQILMDIASDSSAPGIFCVLDALDECHEKERASFIQLLNEYYLKGSKRSNGGHLKFLITSRPYKTIALVFREVVSQFPTIHLAGEEENEAISKEINIVIKSRVQKLSKDLNLDTEIRTKIEDKLLSIPHRTYLWLYLTIEEFYSQTKLTLNALSKFLEALPETVEEAYENILNRNTAKRRKQCQTLLNIVVGARQPLTLKEMDVAFQLATESTYSACYKDLDLDRDHLQTRIRELCGLFVFVDNSKIYLIHQTAKEFLISKNPESYKEALSWKHSLHFLDSEATMADICIKYLLFDDFKDENWPEPGTDVIKWVEKDAPDSHCFFAYCASNWASHFGIAQYTQGRLCVNNLYLDQSRIFRILFKWFWTKKFSGSRRPILSSIHVSCIHGHEAVLKSKIQIFDNIDCKDEVFCQTPMSWAAENGHEAVVKLLLQTGRVDLDSNDNSGPTPLLLAAQNGHEAVVKVLLQTGRIDPDSNDNGGPTPLSWAARNGHEAVVKLLLQTGRVDADSSDNVGWTPLGRAADNGHEAVVKLLLQTGRVDPDSNDNDGMTPLLLAAQNGHEAVVKLLLQTGRVDLHSKGTYGRTPLIWAARNGHEAVVKLLLQTGRVDDPDFKDNIYGRTPLSLAAQKGHEAVVKLLLQTGRVDPDSKDNFGRTPLFWAELYGHIAIVNVLTSYRADSSLQ